MNQHRHMQWDNVIPKRTLAWEDNEGSCAVLLVPRFRQGPLAKWIQPRLKRPHIRVKLDAIGSFVWRRMDGQKTFGQMLGEMRTEFGEAVEPAKDRLVQFFRILHKDRFIELFTTADDTT